MTLDEFIETIETDYLEKALKALESDPQKMVTVYLSAKEYQRSKLIRANFIPEEDQEEKSINITIVK